MKGSAEPKKSSDVKSSDAPDCIDRDTRLKLEKILLDAWDRNPKSDTGCQDLRRDVEAFLETIKVNWIIHDVTTGLLTLLTAVIGDVIHLYVCVCCTLVYVSYPLEY